MLAQLLKHKGNVLESAKMVHLFWVHSVQAVFYQDLGVILNIKRLKMVFTNLVTCPKLLLLGYENVTVIFFETKQHVLVLLCCFCLEERLCG